MTATVDELCTLLESGWTPEQINRLVLVRWVLARDGQSATGWQHATHWRAVSGCRRGSRGSTWH